jgi:tripartite-type tricarboxylate transporter receptor subunit TctC
VSTPVDIISRIIAAELSSSEGWEIVVEDRPGAVVTLAGSEVLKHPADGHWLYAVSAPVTAAAGLLRNVPYRFERDFTSVVQISTSYNVLVVHPSLPAKSISELVDLLKSKPDELTFSSPGFGTPAHLIGEMFKLQTGVHARHIPYQQLSQATADLLNGTNQFEFIAIMPVVDLIRTGKLRALAVTARQRVPILQDVPTVVEEGFPGLVVENWVGFAVKKGTPNEIVLRLNQAVNEALAKPKVREAIDLIGAEPIGGTPAKFDEIVKAEIAHWTDVTRAAGIGTQP